MDVILTGNLGLNWIHVVLESDQLAERCEPRNEPVGFVKNRKLLASEAWSRLVI